MDHPSKLSEENRKSHELKEAEFEGATGKAQSTLPDEQDLKSRRLTL